MAVAESVRDDPDVYDEHDGWVCEEKRGAVEEG